MELPRLPTELPQARRYTRAFHGEQGKKFKSQDTITINIPPISNTYMSKDTKLHFDFDMIYNEASTKTLTDIFKQISTITTSGTNTVSDGKAIAAWNFFGVDEDRHDLGDRPINAYTKPTPTFDINGPYGLIHRIQVFDYLGNTLLEDIQQHDLLTAQFADFWFKDDNMEIDRPRVVDFYEKTSEDTVVRKWPCSRLLPSTYGGQNEKIAVSEFDIVDELDGDKIDYGSPFKGIVPADVGTSQSYSLDLFSFLGKFSDKFVPLHNGYKVVFTLNDFSVPIVFNTPLGGCNVTYRDFTGVTHTTTMDPSIKAAYISNVYIRTDLLEISPELDSKVDKMIFSTAWKYQKDFFPYIDFSKGMGLHNGNRPPFSKRITPDLKSINKIFIGQRYSHPFRGKQNLGFRMRNYLDRTRLLFNKSEVCKMTDTMEFYAATEQSMEKRFDDYLDINDFVVDSFSSTGTNGQQLVPVSYEKRKLISEYLAKTANYDTAKWWPSATNTSPWSDLPSPLSTQFQGRFLVSFDTKIPGASESSVAGIDSSKNVLEYEIESDSSVCEKVDIDVFIEHDAFIYVDPGKSTSVSF